MSEKMEEALIVRDNPAPQPLSAVEMRTRINHIQEVMKAVMKDNTHYGVIPGTSKPTLYKAGSEILLTTFKIVVDPMVEDLSTHDEARYRVTARLTTMAGVFLGSGVGEASSDEEKYKWRDAVSEVEWNAYPEDRRRVKYMRNGDTRSQVRMNIADVRNTVLKMAKKRAQIDATLTVLGASDIFTQDLEDMPAEYVNQGDKQEIRPTQRATASSPSTSATSPSTSAPSGKHTFSGKRDPNKKITEPQAKRFYAIWKKAGWSEATVKDYLQREYSIEHTRDILMDNYEAICNHFSAAPGEPAGVAATADEGVPF